MADYVDLVLCTNGVVLEAPKFSSIYEGDLVVGADDNIDVVKDRISIYRDSEEYHFIAQLYGAPISCVMASYTKRKLVYPEEVTADVGHE